jgi:molybdenum cofactor cytidylyltransferase
MKPPVSAVLLAAGASERMGTLKQLLPLRDKPVITHCIDSIISSGVSDLVVVLGLNGGLIEETISHLPVNVTFNNDPLSDMAESIRTGLQGISYSSTGVLICPGDYPLVSPQTLKMLLDRHMKEPDRIILPAYHGRRGHPGLFPRQIAAEIFQGLTLRDIVRRDEKRLRQIEVPDEGILLDMDTTEDYKKILGLMPSSGPFTG